MESKLVFLLLLICVSFTAGQGDSSDDIANENGRTYPCAVDDMQCIRNYFARSDRCNRSSYEDGRQMHRDLQVSYLPKFNVTIICVDDLITFYNTSIRDMYINTDTNDLVMSVYFAGINIYTLNANFVIHLPGQVPLSVTDAVNVTYTALITFIIPYEGLRGLDGAVVSSYNINAMPPFTIGPKVSDSSVEIVQNFYNALISDIPTAVQELLLTKAPYFGFMYIDHYLCDFGIDYTGEIKY